MSTPKTGYAYKAIREGDRVRRTYLGTLDDPVVRSLLESERLSRATHEFNRRNVEGELKIVETMDQCLRLIQSSINRAVRDLRKRCRRSGQPRVRRLKMSEQSVMKYEYEALVADAADGDMDAVAELRKLLNQNPQLREVLGDLNQHVQDSLVSLASGGALDVRLSLTQALDKQRTQLLAEGDSLLERMLVDQILSSMLDSAICQQGCVQQHAKESFARRWERRLTGAQARHQAAIQTLLEVRQMLETNVSTGESE